jgi:hypothetical protein
LCRKVLVFSQPTDSRNAEKQVEVDKKKKKIEKRGGDLVKRYPVHTLESEGFTKP